MDPDPALTHLYSCSRWAGSDATEESEEQYINTTKLEPKLHCLVILRIDIWGEVDDNLVIFFHGGYWQVSPKEQFLINSHGLYVQYKVQEGTRKVVAPAAVNLLKKGIAMAAVGYDYATPTHSISQMVKQVATAVKFILSKYPNVNHVTLAGHSAGAQLAFKVSTCLKNPRIQKLVLFSGVFELHELPFCEIGSVIGFVIIFLLAFLGSHLNLRNWLRDFRATRLPRRHGCHRRHNLVISLWEDGSFRGRNDEKRLRLVFKCIFSSINCSFFLLNSITYILTFLLESIIAQVSILKCILFVYMFPRLSSSSIWYYTFGGGRVPFFRKVRGTFARHSSSPPSFWALSKEFFHEHA
ncbi:unnamed protein product [Strongylus vulgaris]|uniref:Serine aminopeptidase S33 domain-containing protein n=1 Tax=Strongylus vulgaris TaxID=40348 RepID=A0A3P7JIQ0_STRVU|nr:unnamed protein product [Strongylus vulgaris]